MAASDITVRRATDDDLAEVVAVGAAALGWRPGEPNETLFGWKHRDNPFGRSPLWVATAGDRIAGYRAFMRWELIDSGGRVRRAVRAVDTATHPDFQRRGVFRALTTAAVEEMTAEGVEFVFNTPNDQSRPGYLKLGWVEVGRLPVAARPTGVAALGKLAGARQPASRWSEDTAVGVPALDVVDRPDLDPLLDTAASAGLRTRTDRNVLRWRFGLEPLRYRAWAPDGVDGGVVIFRVRQRGPARECAVSLVLAPPGRPDRAGMLVRGLSRAVDADYVLTLGRRPRGARLVPVRGQGPLLTVRALAGDAPDHLDDWDVQLADIELF